MNAIYVAAECTSLPAPAVAHARRPAGPARGAGAAEAAESSPQGHVSTISFFWLQSSP